MLIINSKTMLVITCTGDKIRFPKLLDKTVLMALTLLNTIEVNSPECLLSKYESGNLSILVCRLLRKLTMILRTVLFRITFLKEYRTTLISDAVTGKIDVRDEVIPQ